MNGSIERFIDCFRRREKTLTTTCSSKPNIPLVVSMDWNLHVKIVLPNKASEQKETHVCKYKKTVYGFKQLDANYLIYNRGVMKTFYDGDSVSE
jgi:hypothetical protein